MDFTGECYEIYSLRSKVTILKEKNKLSQSKFKKFVYAYGSVYKGIRNTAKIFGMSSQKFRHRCKSKNYPDVFFM